MKLRKLMSVLTLALFLFPSMPFIAADPILSVAVDEFYEPGEKVKVSGWAGEGVEIYFLVLFDETSDTVCEETFTADENGKYSAVFQLPEDASEGLYTVTVSSGEENAETSFTVVNEDVEEVEAEEEDVETTEEETETEETEEEETEEEETSEEETPEEEEPPEEESEETEEPEEEETPEEEVEETEEEEDEVPEEEVLAAAEEEAEEEDEEETEDEGLTTEEEAEHAIELSTAISRARRFMDRIEKMVSTIMENGYEIEGEDLLKIGEYLSDADGNLTSAETHLNELENYDTNKAAKKLAIARGLLGKCMGYYHKTVKKVKEDNVQEFIEGVEEDITNLQEKIARLEERLEQGDMVQAALEAKLRQLERLRARLESGETEEVMDELEDVVEGVDEDLDDLDDEETAERFKAMNRVEARVRVLRKMAEKMAEKGEDTKDVDVQVASAEGLMAELMNRMEEGGDGELDDLLESAEEGLKGLGRWLKGLGKPEKPEAGNGED